MTQKKDSIVFATNNAHKLKELREVVGERMDILSLDDIGCHDDIPETGSTLEQNSLIKARWVKDKYGYDCIADDTGLEVEALGGEPGVYSARYAPGEGHDSVANMNYLLANMKGIADRRARFKTVITYIRGQEVHIFEGIVTGKIAEEGRGENGFGYDPIFLPDEAQGLSFAQMTSESKNAISHRGRATRQLIEFLS